MSEIKLSDIVIEGLQSLNTSITSDLTKKIITNTVKMSLHSDASKYHRPPTKINVDSLSKA